MAMETRGDIENSCTIVIGLFPLLFKTEKELAGHGNNLPVPVL
jgi:hypothetical protein